MAKQIVYSETSRHAILRGVNQLADAVKVKVSDGFRQHVRERAWNNVSKLRAPDPARCSPETVLLPPESAQPQEWVSGRFEVKLAPGGWACGRCASELAPVGLVQRSAGPAR